MIGNGILQNVFNHPSFVNSEILTVILLNKICKICLIFLQQYYQSIVN